MSTRRWNPRPRCSRTEGHTADIWIVGEGSDCASVLSSMVESLYLVISEEFTIGSDSPLEFEVHGASPEVALVRFLSEALYLLEGEGVLIIDPRIEAVPEEEGLRIRLTGTASRFTIPERTGVEVKAITYHDALLDIRPEGCSARVLVDI
jgi:SHS2 domain-containing protein